MATLKMGSTTVLTDTTLANAVQDNVTRLGTVTSGNISNSAIVYPAGHIVQTKHSTGSVVSASGQNSTIHSLEITGLDYANNDVLVVASAWLIKSGGGTSAYCRGFLCGGSLGTTTGGQKRFSQPGYTENQSEESGTCMQAIDTAPGAADVTYSVYVQGLGGYTMESSQWSMTLYEIKR